MVKLNKLYTKNGDKGTTHLVGGERVEKCSLRVDAFGDIDELNSHLGMVRTLLTNKYNPDHTKLISKIQNELFDIGSIIATPHGTSWDGMREITEEHVDYLEQWIDLIVADLPELNSFVLPGGTIFNSHLHIARTVCRRAERKLWQINKTEPIPNQLLIYINRLSDLLFALSRYDVFHSEKQEYLWT